MGAGGFQREISGVLRARAIDQAIERLARVTGIAPKRVRKALGVGDEEGGDITLAELETLLEALGLSIEDLKRESDGNL